MILLTIAQWLRCQKKPFASLLSLALVDCCSSSPWAKTQTALRPLSQQRIFIDLSITLESQIFFCSVVLQGENCGNWRFYYCPERIFECVFKHIFALSVWCSGVQTQSSSYQITDLLKIQKFLFDIFISCFGKGELEVVALRTPLFQHGFKMQKPKTRRANC